MLLPIVIALCYGQAIKEFPLAFKDGLQCRDQQGLPESAGTREKVVARTRKKVLYPFRFIDIETPFLYELFERLDAEGQRFHSCYSLRR
jgi:hypothetical protein